MMNFEFEYSFEPATDQQLDAFETEYGLTLSKDYKEFLKINNGGKPVLRRFETLDKVIISSIMFFFPLSEGVEANLEYFFKEYNLSSIVPSNFLPIGRDPMDSLICLVVTGEDQGKVYFCDLDYLEEDKVLKPEFIRLIAFSFVEFLNSLYKTE
ncbi:hypothetical protein AMQ83_08640 [Paenibacillus riograndensis]|nr:hypothetical protein AMQ83_08640 [Paenibacillus riograndensis]